MIKELQKFLDCNRLEKTSLDRHTCEWLSGLNECRPAESAQCTANRKRINWVDISAEQCTANRKRINGGNISAGQCTANRKKINWVDISAGQCTDNRKRINWVATRAGQCTDNRKRINRQHKSMAMLLKK